MRRPTTTSALPTADRLRRLTLAALAASAVGLAGCSSPRGTTVEPAPLPASRPALAEPATRPVASSADRRDRLDNDDSTTGEGLFGRAASAGGGLMLSVGRTPQKIYNAITGRPNFTRDEAAAKLADKDFPDERRVGLNQLAALYGGPDPRPTDPDAYAALAQTDPDPMVRATAIRSLNRARDGGRTGFFVDALSDDDALVRLEAAKALNNLPDPAAAGPLVARLGDPAEDRDVRIAAAEALRHYKSIDAARALVATLNGRDFGVSWQARRSLRQMLGADFRYDEPAWLAYLTGPNDPLG